MLIAHVEREGVWSIDGGMHGLARALAGSAEALGATIRYNEEAAEVLTSNGRACGVRLASGEHIEAGAVIVNADIAAVSGGLFGINARRAAVGTDLEPRCEDGRISAAASQRVLLARLRRRVRRHLQR
jgi:1-hydroxycarotenoid 3,4-desaturase